MFQYPGVRDRENLKENVAELRSWLARFLPELEQQLSNLGTDNFTTAYNERLEGVTQLSGAGTQKTTSEALAEHLLDRKNPHGVSLAQLGFAYKRTYSGWVIRLGPLMLEAKTVSTSGTGAARGSVYSLDVAMGEWDTAFGELYDVWAQATSDVAMSIWGSNCWGADEESAGTVRIFCPVAAVPDCGVTIYGIGRVKDGDE